MYLLFVDESGTHGSSHAFVLGGLAIHENDAASLQLALDELVIGALDRVPPDLEEYELHATDLRNAKKPKGTTALPSLWARVPRLLRLQLLDDAYRLLRTYRSLDPSMPLWTFGVVMDRNFRSSEPQYLREQYAYEVLLNKFDVMLKRLRQDGRPNNGLVIHDRRVVAERDIQGWVSSWRRVAGKVGQLHNIADTPLFTDSRATRLVQMADLIAYSLYRAYSPEAPDKGYLEAILPVFHRGHDGQLHGLVHFTPDFGQGKCRCVACTART